MDYLSQNVNACKWQAAEDEEFEWRDLGVKIDTLKRIVVRKNKKFVQKLLFHYDNESVEIIEINTNWLINHYTITERNKNNENRKNDERLKEIELMKSTKTSKKGLKNQTELKELEHKEMLLLESIVAEEEERFDLELVVEEFVYEPTISESFYGIDATFDGDTMTGNLFCDSKKIDFVPLGMAWINAPELENLKQEEVFFSK